MATKRDGTTAELNSSPERPTKKSKITSEKTTLFGLSALLGAPSLSINQLDAYQRAVNLLKEHINTNPNPRLQQIANEAETDLNYIKDSPIFLAVVGLAGQGKSTFGNKLLWMLDAEADADDAQCNFPLLTSGEDHKTNRCIFCSTSDDGSWNVSFLVRDLADSKAEKILPVNQDSPWDEDSLQKFLMDASPEAERLSLNWSNVLAIELKGPFKLPKGITLVDTPGWNFNFNDAAIDADVDASLKYGFAKATVFLHLSMAARIHGKEDIQILLEKIPLRGESPAIIPAWTCSTAPQRHHAEKIRHALQALKSDPWYGAVDENSDIPDPWERYHWFDSMMASTMLFTLPYSFNYLDSFFSQVRDMHAHPRLVKLHWGFKAFTIFSKRNKKGESSLDDADKLAQFLEADAKEYIKPIWSEETRVLSDIDDFCSLAWDEMVAANKPVSTPQKKKYWNLYQPIGSAVVALRQKTILIYTKLFMRAVEAIEFGKPAKLNLIAIDGEDSDSETEDSQRTNQILNNEFYQFLDENFKQKFLQVFIPKKVAGAIIDDMRLIMSEFTSKIPALFQQEVSLEDSATSFEINDESTLYKETRKTFVKGLHETLEESWKKNIAALKYNANKAFEECVELLRISSPSNHLENIAECIQGIKVNSSNTSVVRKAPLTAKDPLVSINKITDIISQFNNISIGTSRSVKPWHHTVNLPYFKSNSDSQIITVFDYKVKTKEATFSFSLEIGKEATEKIQEFSSTLNTQAAVDKTLFPIFMISNHSEQDEWMKSRKKLFRLADLDLDIINDQFLLFIVIPKSQLEYFKNLVNKQLPADSTAKSRIFYILLAGADENTTASLWLDVSKSLAEYWKFNFYWKISHNAFYHIGELDLANFGRRQASLARGLLILQSIVHGYRFYAAQEFAKILNDMQVTVAVNALISKNNEDAANFFLVRDKRNFVSFGALEKLVKTIEYEAEKQNNKEKLIAEVIVKFNNLLRKVAMICAVESRSLFSKLAMCFPYLFMIETSPAHQTRFFSLNNTFAQQNVFSRKLTSNSFAKEIPGISFWQDYKEKESVFAERCKTVNKSLPVITPYLVFKDNTLNDSAPPIIENRKYEPL